MSKLLFLILFFNILYGDVDYEIFIEKTAPFSQSDIVKMAKLGAVVALDGEGYQADEKVKSSMKPKDLIDAKLLDLHGINLQVIPSWLFRFQNLRYLNLSNTNINITEVKKLLNNNAFKKLDVLILSNNLLFEDSNESFSDFTNILPVLNVLDLSNTGGRALNYKGIDNIKNLQELNLGHNTIDKLEPLRLDRLKNLQKIELSFNQLEMIDLNLFPKSVTSIDVSNNKLKELKVSEFKYLERLDLTNNPNLKNNPKLCGEFLLPDKSIIIGNNICNKQKDINYFVSLGIFSKKENAKRIHNRLLKKRFPVSIVTKTRNHQPYYIVKVGFYENRENANQIQKKLPKKYRKTSKVCIDKRGNSSKYVVRFGVFSKIDNIKKIRDALLRKNFSAFIIRRKIRQKYLYSLEVGFFLTKDMAESKRKEILNSFSKNYFEEEPILNEI